MTTKIKFFLLCFALMGLTNCKSSQFSHQSTSEIGLFKVAILYPSGEGKTFDMDYYEKTHMPLVAGFLGENLKFYEIDRGITGRTPNDPAPYVAIGYFYCHDVAEYNKAIAANRDVIVNDIKKYTNIQPVVQVSQIKQLGVNDKK